MATDDNIAGAHFDEIEQRRMAREIEAARCVLEISDSFHDLTVEQQCAEIAKLCAYRRAALDKSPELRAFRAGGLQ